MPQCVAEGKEPTQKQRIGLRSFSDDPGESRTFRNLLTGQRDAASNLRSFRTQEERGERQRERELFVCTRRDQRLGMGRVEELSINSGRGNRKIGGGGNRAWHLATWYSCSLL